MNSAERGVVLHCLKSMIDEAACEECPLYGTTGTDHCEKDCVRLAINTLEQEPCGDAISREAAVDACLNGWNKDYKEIVAEIRALPPVTPQYTEAEIQKMQELEQAEIQKAYELGKAEQPKMGRWKRVSMDKYVQHAMAYYRCSECGKDIIGTHNYCPSCGAKMQEVQK